MARTNVPTAALPGQSRISERTGALKSPGSELLPAAIRPAPDRELLQLLRLTFFDANITIERTDDTLLISFRAWDAEVGVTIAGPARPSFKVTHPAVREQSMTISDAREQAATGVLFERLAWVVREIVAYGVVLPEFHTMRQTSGRRSRL